MSTVEEIMTATTQLPREQVALIRERLVELDEADPISRSEYTAFFLEKLEIGLAASREGRVVPHDEVVRRFKAKRA